MLTVLKDTEVTLHIPSLIRLTIFQHILFFSIQDWGVVWNLARENIYYLKSNIISLIFQQW